MVSVSALPCTSPAIPQSKSPGRRRISGLLFTRFPSERDEQFRECRECRKDLKPCCYEHSRHSRFSRHSRHSRPFRHQGDTCAARGARLFRTLRNLRHLRRAFDCSRKNMIESSSASAGLSAAGVAVFLPITGAQDGLSGSTFPARRPLSQSFLCVSSLASDMQCLGQGLHRNWSGSR